MDIYGFIELLNEYFTRDRILDPLKPYISPLFVYLLTLTKIKSFRNGSFKTPKIAGRSWITPCYGNIWICRNNK